MNDKCAAGTGKFLEIMANRLCVGLEELFALAAQGTPLAISALCTVFAESEVISCIGEGKPRADIAAGVVLSLIHICATGISSLPTRTSSRAIPVPQRLQFVV